MIFEVDNKWYVKNAICRVLMLKQKVNIFPVVSSTKQTLFELYYFNIFSNCYSNSNAKVIQLLVKVCLNVPLKHLEDLVPMLTGCFTSQLCRLGCAVHVLLSGISYSSCCGRRSRRPQ